MGIANMIATFMTTTFFFIVEALIHFNIGKTGRISLSVMPSRKELTSIVTVVVIFAFMSVVVGEMISRLIGTDK